MAPTPGASLSHLVQTRPFIDDPDSPVAAKFGEDPTHFVLVSVTASRLGQEEHLLRHGSRRDPDIICDAILEMIGEGTELPAQRPEFIPGFSEMSCGDDSQAVERKLGRVGT